jgi:hypothetical protein
MKIAKNTLLALFILVAAFACAFAQQSPRVDAESKNVKIEYGQPSKKGRLLFGDEASKSLEKYGKIWRTGANMSNTITFKKDGQFGGKSVKAGSYSLFTIPGATEWVVILNEVVGENGTYTYKQDKDVLRISVPAKKYGSVAEKLIFTVKETSLGFQWDKEGFSVPLKF